MKIKQYDLPDVELLENSTSTYRYMIWEPEYLCIVLGQSNQPDQSVYAERAAVDGVPVYKRPSGGETVVLSPKTLVISILKREIGLRSPRLYFSAYNEKIIQALRGLGVKNLSAKGISDICIGDQKILGSSIYRDKDRVFYHGVLNRAESVDLIERYLKHPLREPEYRDGRSHRDFVTSLVQQGYRFTSEEIRRVLIEELKK
ncbi:MAG: lipoate--protein ligase family protein [Candidatus Aminicenantes bacterium]|nr:MAG: lipoate--protein ligase family protein [Candidatus Aminicenantes bacterium]